MNKINLLSSCALLVLVAALSTSCHQPTTATTSSAPPVPATAALSTPAPHPEDAMPRVSVQEAKAALEKGTAVIIDVRGPDAYNAAHIKGSIDHGLSRLEQSDFKDLPKDKRIIAYCSCPAEHSSSRAALVLQKAGFKDAGALVGGNMAWEAAGYEMVKAPPPSPSPVAAASPNAKQPAKPETKAKAGKK